VAEVEAAEAAVGKTIFAKQLQKIIEFKSV